ncbi:MAG: hypothetical protein KAQ92_00040 [Candidatus Aenigmarchaeota archaeon]|nr:hypothetical protein [Candidatus Aenigmarchaeota archaeon]
MSLEGVDVMRAEDLPMKVRTKEGIFTGFVELRYERHSPLTVKINPINGLFSQRFREITKKEGKIGKINF